MKMIKQIIGILCILLSMSSCVREELIDRSDVVEGEPVRVSLNMKMAAMGGIPATRATVEKEKEIERFRVMVFNEWGKKITDKSFAGSVSTIQIDTYTGKNQTIFAVANATEVVNSKLDAATTLEEAQTISANREQLALGAANDQFDQHTTPLMMTGLMTNVLITPTKTSLGELKLHFMVAKLTLNVSDATSESQTVTLLGWDIVDEPVNTYIYPNEARDVSSVGKAEDWHSSVSTEGGRYRFKEREKLPGDDRIKATATMTIYMLENRQGGRKAIELTTEDIKKYPGIDKEPKSDKHKAFFAPDRATYIQIYAVHEDAEGAKQVVAKIYIGADAIEDYNVARGNHYTFNVKVTGWDDIDIDSNVDYTLGEVEIVSGTNLTMDTHPDFRALTVTSPKGWMAMEIVDNDGRGTTVYDPNFKSTWLKLSPLSLMHMQQKQSGNAWQEEDGIVVGGFAHGRYIPNEKVRSILPEDVKWWKKNGIHDTIANYGDYDDKKLTFEKARNKRRMCYQINSIPFTEDKQSKTLFIYAEENHTEIKRTARIKLSFWAAKGGDMTTPPAAGALPDYVTFKLIEQVGFLTIYSNVNDDQSGMCQLDATGNPLGKKKRFAVEQHEETAMMMNPGIGENFQEMKIMQWGFTDKNLYDGANKNRNGRFLTANAVFASGVTAAADGNPTWNPTVATYRELYGSGTKKDNDSNPVYTGIIEQPYRGSTSPPYFYPMPDRKTAYHPIFNSSAARYCYEKNRDINGDGKINPEEAVWYLPSRDQMLMIMIANQSILENSGLTPITNDADVFWTSTERSSYRKLNDDGEETGPTLNDESYAVRIIVGFSPSINEKGAYRVRCVRDIP